MGAFVLREPTVSFLFASSWLPPPPRGELELPPFEGRAGGEALTLLALYYMPC